MSFINRYLQDLEVTTAAKTHPSGGAPPRENLRRWLPPVGLEVKMNVDGGLS